MKKSSDEPGTLWVPHGSYVNEKPTYSRFKIWISRSIAFLILVITWMKLKVLGYFKLSGFYPYLYNPKENEAVYWINGLALVSKIGKDN